MSQAGHLALAGALDQDAPPLTRWGGAFFDYCQSLAQSWYRVGKAVHSVAMESDRMPSPPFPAPDSPVLWMIIENSLRAYNAGEVDVRGAIVHAAVHGWYEGHAQGEDACPGCDFRGELPKQHWKGADNRAQFAQEQREPNPGDE